MSRKVVRLTVDNFLAVGAPCQADLFWELDPVRRSRVRPEEALAEKEAWISEVLREWGSCGRVVEVDDEPVGFVLYAPPPFVPGAAGFPTAPVSSDAVVLTTAYVLPQHRWGGLGRMLIQGMVRDLIKHGGCVAVEAFGSTREPPPGGRAQAGAQESASVLPATFLGSVGFKTQRAHPTSPRMRMELKSALTWRDEVEQALERLARLWRPAPAGEVSRSDRRAHP